MIYKFDSWKPMTADTQSQIDAIFNQVTQYNVSPRPSHLFHRKLKRDNVHDFQ